MSLAPHVIPGILQTPIGLASVDRRDSRLTFKRSFLGRRLSLRGDAPRNSMSNQPRRTRTKRVDFTFYVIQLLSTIAFQGEISHPNAFRILPGEARLRSSLKAHASQVTRYAIRHTVVVRALVVSVCCIDEWIRSRRKKARPGTTGLLYPIQ
jgi:hypothetical protein